MVAAGCAGLAFLVGSTGVRVWVLPLCEAGGCGRPSARRKARYSSPTDVLRNERLEALARSFLAGLGVRCGWRQREAPTEAGALGSKYWSQSGLAGCRLRRCKVAAGRSRRWCWSMRLRHGTVGAMRSAICWSSVAFAWSAFADRLEPSLLTVSF